MLLSKESSSSIRHLLLLKGKQPPASVLGCYWMWFRLPGRLLSMADGLVWAGVPGSALGSNPSSAAPAWVPHTLTHTGQAAAIHGVACPRGVSGAIFWSAAPLGMGMLWPRTCVQLQSTPGSSVALEELRALPGISLKRKQRGDGFAALLLLPLLPQALRLDS